MSGKTIYGNEINSVLAVVRRLSSDGDVQLSILAYALRAACKSCGVERKLAVEQFDSTFDQEIKLEPLQSIGGAK